MSSSARFGSYLIIPLKHDAADIHSVAAGLSAFPITSMDFNQNVKAMLSGVGNAAVGRCCRLDAEEIRRAVTGGRTGRLEVCREEERFSFDFYTSYLYLFRTGVAFLCLGITYDRMEALNTLYSPGHANETAPILLEGEPVGLEDGLTELCRGWGLRKFFDGPSSLLLEAFVHTTGLRTAYFSTLEELRRVTFRLHQMIPLEAGMDDESEEDTRYVYAVKSEEQEAYRWGCCISSQTLSYAVASESPDLAAELDTQAADALPMAVLMLYQKYTCLHFTALIADRKEQSASSLRRLKQMMLEFRAYGRMTPAILSRWHNVRRIYQHLLDTNDVDAMVADISDKLNILAAEQETAEARRSTRVINIITVFGIVSILASVLSIIQILSGGGAIFWISTALTTLALLVILGLAMFDRK